MRIDLLLCRLIGVLFCWWVWIICVVSEYVWVICGRWMWWGMVFGIYFCLCWFVCLKFLRRFMVLWVIKLMFCVKLCLSFVFIFLFGLELNSVFVNVLGKLVRKCIVGLCFRFFRLSNCLKMYYCILVGNWLNSLKVVVGLVVELKDVLFMVRDKMLIILERVLFFVDVLFIVDCVDGGCFVVVCF